MRKDILHARNPASGADRCKASRPRMMDKILLGALLVLVCSTDAVALDRFRCIPADGGEAYTSPGSCRSDTDNREPLTREEIDELEAIERRGKPFYRCTAADGSYSMLVHSGECPAATDTRTVVYAQQPVRSTSETKQAPQPAEPQPAPARLERPAAPQPAAVTPAMSASQPDAGQTQKGTGWFGKLMVAALVAPGLFVAFKWLGRRHEQSKAARRHAPATRRSSPAAGAPAAARQPDPADIDLNEQAQIFLAALDQGGDVPGGLEFRRALQQSNLDYSLESLDRVEQLLNQIRTRQSPQREAWRVWPGAGNFCLVLAYYMGTVLSRQTNIPIRWCTRDQASTYMPSGMPIPAEDWARVVGVIGTTACVPLGLIEDKLFNEAGEMTCRAYVERLASRMPGASAADENSRCEEMLEALRSDKEIKGGLKFRDQLKKIQPDDSLASLDRLEQLLKAIRTRLAPQYEAFVNGADTQNFLRLAAFYMGMTVARAGNMSVKWLDYQTARNELPDLEFGFETTSVCVLNGFVYFPLGLVTEILFHPTPQRTMADWVRDAMKNASAPRPSILRSSLLSTSAIPLDPQIAAAVHRAGFMAAWGMHTAVTGSPSAPTLFVPGEGDTGTFSDFSFYSSQEEAFAVMDGQMHDNPQGVPFQIKSYDGYANLHTGRTDAITLELQIYPGKWAAAKQGLAMSITCPYRHASHPRGFAIYSPKLLECAAPLAWHDSIFQNFYLGVQHFKAEDFDWFKYLDEAV